jgi:flagellar secretion chaperone FliS
MNPRLTYRESAVAGASPVRQVILLYEQAIEDLRRALTACRTGQVAGQVEERTRQLNHAILILGCLQSSLDHERGGTVAANLERFYNQVRAGLVEAQFRQSPAAIERQIALLVEIHQAWCEVERAQAVSAALPEIVPEDTPVNAPQNAHGHTTDRSTPIPAESAAVRSSAEWNA